MKKKSKSTILMAVAFFIGLSLLLYPSISNAWNSVHQSRVIESYSNTVAEIDVDKFEEYFADAREYNKQLLNKVNRYHLTDEEMENYNSLLNISENGIMGYIEIPSINVSLPIYHGVEETVLQTAVGHIEGSSLPVGGKSTHCVLSGHRGLPSAKLFTNLDKMTEGDYFVLYVLDEMLTYEVDQVHIVEPDDVKLLEIQKGEDLCTLVTCTPYGVNSHRLLVRGHRIENKVENNGAHVTADAVQIQPIMVAPVLAIPVLILLMVYVTFSGGKKEKSKKKPK